MALKQDGLYFVLCPKKGNKIEGDVLSRVCILGFFCPKQETLSGPPIPNIGRVPTPPFLGSQFSICLGWLSHVDCCTALQKVLILAIYNTRTVYWDKPRYKVVIFICIRFLELVHCIECGTLHRMFCQLVLIQNKEQYHLFHSCSFIKPLFCSLCHKKWK